MKHQCLGGSGVMLPQETFGFRHNEVASEASFDWFCCLQN